MCATSWRAAAGYRLIDPLELTAESYLALYVAPVRRSLSRPAPETSFSWVAGTTAEWTWRPGWATLLGGAFASTPYALADTQVFARLRVDLGFKVTFPLVCLIMTLIGVPFAFSMGKRGTLVGIGLACSNNGRL